MTCLTVQDTRNVYDSVAVDSDLILRQLKCLAHDTTFHAVKTGALGNASIVEALLAFLADHPAVPLIVDPVIKAAGGGNLADEALIDRMRRTLFQRAEVITPNGVELAQLSGEQDPAKAADQILSEGCGSVLATGGHGLGETIVNVLFRSGQEPTEWHLDRIGGEYHGTGCTLAAALAAGRAQGLSLEEAIAQAQTFVSGAIGSALAVGRGQPVPDRHYKSNI